MNEQRRDALVRRVLEVAVGLESLSEAPASRALDAKPRITGSKEQDLPTTTGSRLDRFLERLEELVEDGEKTLREGRKGRPVKDTVESREFWIITKYEGVDCRTVALAEGLDPIGVQRIRERHRRTMNLGKPLAA